MGEDVTSVRNQAKYMTFLVSAWTVMARAMAAGARSSEPPDRWLPSPLSCSFSTRWYLNRISCSVSWYIVKCYLGPKPERLATGWVSSLSIVSPSANVRVLDSENYASGKGMHLWWMLNYEFHVYSPTFGHHFNLLCLANFLFKPKCLRCIVAH